MYKVTSTAPGSRDLPRHQWQLAKKTDDDAPRAIERAVQPTYFPTFGYWNYGL